MGFHVGALIEDAVVYAVAALAGFAGAGLLLVDERAG